MAGTWEKSRRVWDLPTKRSNRFGFDLKLTLILSLLKEFSELTNYDLHRKIEQRSGIDLSYGSIYPMMQMLLHEELIRSRVVSVEKNGSMRKQLYSLTEKGENQLEITLLFLERLRLPPPRVLSTF
jgi:DNA-binding PadR family transcriptional regulator